MPLLAGLALLQLHFAVSLGAPGDVLGCNMPGQFALYRAMPRCAVLGRVSPGYPALCCSRQRWAALAALPRVMLFYAALIRIRPC
jgi:hypothetical protein